jgi:hypothetical protein
MRGLLIGIVVSLMILTVGCVRSQRVVGGAVVGAIVGAAITDVSVHRHPVIVRHKSHHKPIIVKWYNRYPYNSRPYRRHHRR